MRKSGWSSSSAACAIAVWLASSFVAEHASGQVVTTVAGDPGRTPGFADGAGTYAIFNYPTSLAVATAVDGEGMIIYVADKMNGACAQTSRAVRRVGGCARARISVRICGSCRSLTSRPWCAALCRAGPHSRRYNCGKIARRPPLEGLHTGRA